MIIFLFYQRKLFKTNMKNRNEVLKIS